MKRFRDTTYGETLTALNRYRPFIGVVVAVVLVQILLPAKDGGTDTDLSTSVASEVPSASVAHGPSVPGGASDVAAAPALGGEVQPTPSASTGSSVGGATSGAAPSATAAAASAPGAGAASYPGIGTPAALSAPDCDRATGSLMMFTKFHPLPCVPLWAPGGDNGGATWRGVTADTITVVVFQEEQSAETDAFRKGLGSGTHEELWDMMSKYTDLFNRHAELYGRKVKLVRQFIKGSGNEAVRAAAIDAVNKHKPFAAINGTAAGWTISHEMAVRKVISPSCCGPDIWDMYQKNAPYLWNVNPGRNGTERQSGYMRAEFLAKRLAGRPAKWAGDALMRTQTRKFGWLYTDGAESNAERQVFLAELRKYGITFAATAGVNATDQAQATEQIRTAIAKFKSAGVNVVLPDGGFLGETIASKEATNQRYFPEWFGGGPGGAPSASTILIRAFWDATQARSLYGLKAVPVQATWEQGDLPQLYAWEHGTQPVTSDITIPPQIYHLFLGFHSAGPNLTPLTFRDAIFARPPVGGARDGAVTSVERSYGLHGVWPFEAPTQPDFGGADDAAYFWWCSTCNGRDELGTEGIGMQWVPEGGKRFRAQTLPRTEAPLFVQAGGVGSLSEIPANERSKPYPVKKACASRWQCFGAA